MLNFRHLLSLKQQRALSDLAAACDFPHRELGFDDPEWDEEFKVIGVPRSVLQRARAARTRSSAARLSRAYPETARSESEWFAPFQFN
jgi:hypothetical protein